MTACLTARGRAPAQGSEIRIGVRLVAERPGGQPRELARVSVGERDGDAVGCEVGEPVDRVRGEAGFRLLAIGDDGDSVASKRLMVSRTPSS